MNDDNNDGDFAVRIGIALLIPLYMFYNEGWNLIAFMLGICVVALIAGGLEHNRNERKKREWREFDKRYPRIPD